jgi:hypothetical protein
MVDRKAEMRQMADVHGPELVDGCELSTHAPPELRPEAELARRSTSCSAWLSPHVGFKAAQRPWLELGTG